MHQGNTNQRYGFDYINCRKEYHLGISKKLCRGTAKRLILSSEIILDIIKEDMSIETVGLVKGLPSKTRILFTFQFA